MPAEIQVLADTILVNPQKVAVSPVSSTAEMIQQEIFFVDKGDKKNLLNFILKDKSIATALVFTRTKHGADKVVKDLVKAGITAEAIHGNKSQNARQRALSNFKNRSTRVLVATDIAARGIDVDELTHVINYELPNVPETYVHRIGRTGRAGASGIALSFCDAEEAEFLHDIQKLIAKQIPVNQAHPYPMPIPVVGPASKAGSTAKSKGGKSGSARRGGPSGLSGGSRGKRPNSSRGQRPSSK
jgi:ATP-dependent RNA helicase RhlE